MNNLFMISILCFILAIIEWNIGKLPEGYYWRDFSRLTLLAGVFVFGMWFRDILKEEEKTE